MKKIGVNPGKEIIGFSPASTKDFRKWPDKSWAELSRRLIADSRQVIIFGGPGEEKSIRRIKEPAPDEVKSCFVSLEQEKGLLSLLGLLVGVDSGRGHLAASVGTDTLTLFSATQPKHSMPYSPQSHAVRGNNPPTYIVTQKQREQARDCMRSITVEQVYKKILDILPDQSIF
jgi:ADP-heptose:LPS heptosyltransferase